MGSTGSGKSSLLNILARRLKLTPGLVVDGTVLINNASRPAGWRAAYVQQDDKLFAELTVQETLAFSARLRLPESMSEQLRAARCAAVARTLGLGGAMHTRVGDELSRGISGGERKRLSLANECVA
jgi:ABC-type multidrug transport system ATPase subunit